eukprot:1867853-Rhodomonas_salina.2
MSVIGGSIIRAAHLESEEGDLSPLAKSRCSLFSLPRLSALLNPRGSWFGFAKVSNVLSWSSAPHAPPSTPHRSASSPEQQNSAEHVEEDSERRSALPTLRTRSGSTTCIEEEAGGKEDDGATEGGNEEQRGVAARDTKMPALQPSLEPAEPCEGARNGMLAWMRRDEEG